MSHERFRADEGLFANDCAIQNDCAHPNKCFITHLAGVNNRAMADSDPIAKDAGIIIREVQHGVVLNVGMVPDNDAVDIAAQDCTVPYARMRAERYIADDSGGFGDEDAFAKLRRFSKELIKLLVHLHLRQSTPNAWILKIKSAICGFDLSMTRFMLG